MNPAFLTTESLIDACQVKNGECDLNAICSHDGITNAIICTCKTGYVNTGSQSNVTCTGELDHPSALEQKSTHGFHRRMSR